jgi:hypothetical protein
MNEGVCMTQTLNNAPPLNDAPRPSSLRALVAWFFALSFRDYPDKLERGADKDDNGEKIKGDWATPFAGRLRQLTWWPPDIFALTSAVLSRTGAYRMIVGPHRALGQNLWQRLDWQARVEAHAEAWRSTVSELLLQPLTVNQTKGRNSQHAADEMLWEALDERVRDRCKRRYLERLVLPPCMSTSEGEKKQGKRTQGKKRQGPSPDDTDNLIEVFLRDIIELEDDDGLLADQHLLAVSVKAERRNRSGAGYSEQRAARFFEAVIGLHILADAAAGSIGMPRDSTQESSVFDAFANVMLTLRGSLSTVSKFHGVVLPKMRTPQSGLTIRNLSHNLTFHDCEVEVMWRSFPWSNFDENTLNVLYVPYPFDFKANRFTGDTAHHESVGYFTYDPGEWKEIGGVIISLIDNISSQGTNPHMLVFTETAFNEDTYKRLLTALSNRYSDKTPQRMPVVVAGIAKKVHDLPYNELRVATYFAGKWYQLSQHKHHRWQLNDSQIRQYGLQGRLSTARPLFESSVMDQRRLTFYAPAPWLVLSPLICEDLSRIEPVSELIRGVGPTLVLALLLDGPQLAERWPGRYASVLADDPGTGVLTVTSYGMAKTSRPHASSSPSGANPKNNDASGHDEAVVASWKDPTSSFQKLSASKDQALLITLTAKMAEQFTLDRRGLVGKSAGFRLDGVVPVDMPTPSGILGGDAHLDLGIDTRLDLGNWSDIREVTAVTYVASAALSLLRPHVSRHPKPREARKRTDTWYATQNWEDGNQRTQDWRARCHRVHQLIDLMLGRPVWVSNKKWEEEVNNEVERLKGCNDGAACPPDYFMQLKVARNFLLNHIFKAAPGTGAENREAFRLAPNRHLFAVLGFSQSTIDVEVRDDEAVWPTDALGFGSIVLRILLDSIAGIESSEKNGGWGSDKAGNGSEVYLRRLRIAGRANRGKTVLWAPNEVDESGRDVKAAPRPLYVPNTTRARGKGDKEQIRYLRQFKKLHRPDDGHPDSPSVYDHPNRHDFYRMVLELVDAILDDEEASLWKRCQQEFKGQVNEAEMRRLTLLVLMTLPALIHEQLEFDYIRLKRINEIDLSGNIMHELMKKAEKILTSAGRKTRTPWNPRKTK